MKISIITINYNNKEGLRNTIESVVTQTYTDYEYIIIDGGSNDGSIDIIRQYADKISYWVSEPDKGIYNAMNKGIVQARGEYLNFMNSGDVFYNNETLASVVDTLDADIVSGKTYYEGGVHGFFKDKITMLDLYRKTLPHQASFIKRNLFDKRKYDETLKIASDWKFFVEAIVFDNCSFRNIDNIICAFDGKGISARIPFKFIDDEQEQIRRLLLPPRILADYKYLYYANSPILELTPAFNRTIGFQKFIYKLIKVLISIHNKIGKKQKYSFGYESNL